MTGGFDVPLVDEVGDSGARWAGTAHILGPHWARQPLLSLGLIGVQLLWSVEMSYASPYLISLGLSKSGMAMVFIAGPISGLVVQPLIGLLADTSKSRFGRRRPYILGGTAFCTFFILLLGYTRQFASIVTTIGSSANDRLTIWLAVFSIFCIDFGINAVMSMDRALIVDTLPSEKQPSGSAWAARMMGIGSVVGFFIGGLDMPSLFPFFGSTEIEVISALSAIALVVTHAITCYCTRERVLISLPERQQRKGFLREVKSTWTTFRSLPYAILRICIIQFFAWLGWFPVLFYTSLFVGDFYRRSASASSTLTAEYVEAEANRLGSRAMTISAILTLLTNIAAPILVSKRKTGPEALLNTGPKPWYKRKMHMATIWALSHMFFAACMFATFFVGNVLGATIVMSLTGICWGITLWAPFALLGEEIVASTSELPGVEETIVLADHRTPLESREEVFAVADDSDSDEDRTAKPEMRPRWSGDGDDPRAALMGNVDARQSWVDIGPSGHEAEGRGQDPTPRSGLSAKAGTILGIHNTFIVAPQFLVTGLASIIFAIFEPDKSAIHGGKRTASYNTTVTDAGSDLALIGRDDSDPQEAAVSGPNTTAIIFRLGGVAAVVASVICWRLAGYLRRRG
ncbi:MFS general substrate transporter [Peniophora sp. CONT]|nr:MFS general substrate transporter [Peniophora sp. CONT]